MPRYIAFLRAINVGGSRTVTMASLRRAFEPLGFSSVSTFIASGNVLFETSSRSTAALQVLIGKRLRAALGYEVAAFVRSDRELVRIAAYKAFPESEMGASSELAIVFLAAALDAKTKQRLKALSTKTNAFRVHGREIYWLRRKGPGASTLLYLWTKLWTSPLPSEVAGPFKSWSVNFHRLVEVQAIHN